MAQFRGGMNELMRQAARLQRKVEQTKKELGDKEIVATSVGDKVKATVTYAGKLAKVEIDPEFLQSEGIDSSSRSTASSPPSTPASSRRRRRWRQRSRRSPGA
jgi:nucleoid-associated protein EbfC